MQTSRTHARAPDRINLGIAVPLRVKNGKGGARKEGEGETKIMENEASDARRKNDIADKRQIINGVGRL
jgi:hypothetical protein